MRRLFLESGRRLFHTTPAAEHLMKLTRCRVVDNSPIGKLAMAEGKPPKIIHVYNRTGVATIGNETLIILTYNELNHSLPACMPVSANFKYYYHCGAEKRWGRLFGQTFFQQPKFVTIIRFELLVVGCQAYFNYTNRRGSHAMCTYVGTTTTLTSRCS